MKFTDMKMTGGMKSTNMKLKDKIHRLKTDCTTM